VERGQSGLAEENVVCAMGGSRGWYPEVFLHRSIIQSALDRLERAAEKRNMKHGGSRRNAGQWRTVRQGEIVVILQNATARLTEAESVGDTGQRRK